MHRLVRGEGEEAATESGELALASLRWRFDRLVEISFCKRLEDLQIVRPQLEILLADFGEGRVSAGVVNRLGVFAEELPPACCGGLLSEEDGGNRAFDQC